MEPALFKIEASSTTQRQVEKTTQCAGIHFDVKVDGQQVPLRRLGPFREGNTSLYFGESYSPELCRGYFYVTKFGKTMAKNTEESKVLVDMKPILEGLLTAVAKALTENLARPDAEPKKDLLTGEELPATPIAAAPRVVAEYRFYDPVVESVTETVETPARLLFTSLLPLPSKPVRGTARGCTVVLEPMGHSGLEADLRFSNLSWLTAGVSQLRERFGDDVIAAAFRNLVQNWLALDEMPKDAQRWRAASSTAFRLVEE